MNKYKYLVSVVITSYNYGKFLGFAVESVLSQSFQDFEIIIIDDGSTDNTRAVAESYLSDGRIRYIYQPNSGQPKAKNRGIEECSGRFVAFLDADDVWMTTKLERQLPLFNDPDVAVVFSRRIWIDPSGHEIPGNERILFRGKVLDHIFIDNFICFSSSVVRHSLLDEFYKFDESLPMGIDYDLWIHLASRFKFDFVDAPLVKYRTGHANLSKNILRRYECAHIIMDKAINDPEIKRNMSWWVPRLASADTWANKAYYARNEKKYSLAATCYLKSMFSIPFYFRAWKGLLCCMIKKST